MTKNQQLQFNRMRATLINISKRYMSPAKMRKDSEKEYGLDFEDTIEMAYENIQTDAARAVKGVKEIKGSVKTT